MARYEAANNSHDIGRVAPMIDADATYWFSDGSHRGVGEITAAIERTFSTIHDEVYEIKDLEWLVAAPDHAVCRYRFSWTGVVDGRTSSGQGRGTNVLVNRGGSWTMQHEHLSG